jgi:hypothetical protein
METVFFVRCRTSYMARHHATLNCAPLSVHGSSSTPSGTSRSSRTTAAYPPTSHACERMVSRTIHHPISVLIDFERHLRRTHGAVRICAPHTTQRQSDPAGARIRDRGRAGRAHPRQRLRHDIRRLPRLGTLFVDPQPAGPTRRAARRPRNSAPRGGRA